MVGCNRLFEDHVKWIKKELSLENKNFILMQVLDIIFQT